MPNVVSSIDSFNFPRTRGEIVVTLSQQLTCLSMPPLNKLKSGAFTKYLIGSKLSLTVV